MQPNRNLYRSSCLSCLILFLWVHDGLGQSSQSKESYQLSSRQISLDVGRGFIPVRFPPEVRDLDRSFNGAIMFRGKQPSGIQLGVFANYQQRSGKFAYYRLLPRAGGTLQKEVYAIGGEHLSIGAKASLPLNEVFSSTIGVHLPNWLDVYQSFFLGVVRTEIMLPDSLVETGVTIGFGSATGVSEFPAFGEDIQLVLGTMIGVKVHIPHTSISLFSEFGFGPLESVNVGLSVRLKYAKHIEAVNGRD